MMTHGATITDISCLLRPWEITWKWDPRGELVEKAHRKRVHPTTLIRRKSPFPSSGCNEAAFQKFSQIEADKRVLAILGSGRVRDSDKIWSAMTYENPATYLAQAINR